MELTDKEIGYLELYKGKSSGIKKLNLGVKEMLEGYYSYIFEYQNINSFMNFLATKDPKLMDRMYIEIFKRDFLENMIDMIVTVSNIACRYGLENKLYHKELFRYENKNNIINYEEGQVTSSFKSTSTSDSESTVFNKEDTVPLVIKTKRFIPYIYLDEVVDTNEFSDEKEVLFPPFINGVLTGRKEKHHYWDFYEVKVDDSYTIENIELDDVDYEHGFGLIKNDFANEFNLCKKNGVVSDKLKQYCDITYKFLYIKLRNMYLEYSLQHMLKMLDEGGFDI